MPENYANRYQTTLTAGVTSGATTGTVASVTGVPSVPFRAIIGAEGANTDEIVLVTGRSGTTLTWTRASEAVAGVQVASAHGVAATVTAILTASAITTLSNRVAAGVGALSAGASLPSAVTGINAILSTLKAAGLMSASFVETALAIPDILVYYRLGEPSGVTAVDASGVAGNGTYVNAPTLGVASLLANDADTAMTGVATSRVTGPTIAAQAAWSICFMVKGAAGANDFDMYFNTPSDRFDIAWANGTTQIQFYDGTAWTDCAAFGSRPSAAGMRFIFTYEAGTGLTVYKNGVQTYQNAGKGRSLLNAAFYVGGTSGGTSSSTDTLDEFIMYSRALTLAEVALLEDAAS